MAKPASLEIELVFLPPYAPNLNLIDRLWRLAKQEVPYRKFQPDYERFCQASTTCLAQTHTTPKQAMHTLLIPKFQTQRISDVNP